MNEDAYRSKDDRDVLPDAPIRQIFEVRLDPVGDVLARAGRPPEAANLREAGDSGLDGAPLPVAVVDIPEEIVFRRRTSRVRARSDDAHFTPEDIEELRKFVDAGVAQDRADGGYAVILSRSGSGPNSVARIQPH